MKKPIIIISSLGIMLLLIAGVSFSLYSSLSQPKIAYVQTDKVYNEFVYKKELEVKYEEVLSYRKRILDSLEIQINAISVNIQNSEHKRDENMQTYQYLVMQYQEKEKTFEEDNQKMLQNYTEQIWSQLNKYIEEYGNAEKIDFIYGANGSGSVMHANKRFDLTDKMISYVNERYQGGALK